ncbi:MAG: flavocytochrome c [Tissierellia bacterium]|nr:flavocytochrome c [Tissierellia bacterium]
MKKTISLVLIFALIVAMLTACGKSEPAPVEPETQEEATEEAQETVEDMSTDIVVIGAGGAGMAAALSAAEKGSNVILLEKMPMVGGNTTRATGGINAAGTKAQAEAGIEDDIETFIEDTMEGGKGQNNPHLVRVLAENSNGAIEWLESLGADLSDVGLGGGATNKRFHRPAGGAAVGAEVVRVLKENVDKSEKITLLLDTEATKIIKEEDTVVGVMAKSKEGEFKIDAKAVIVTTGGFSANPDMVIEQVEELEGFATTNQPGATGEGIVMAQEVGARLIQMNHIQTHPTVVPEKGIMITEAVRGNGAIVINRSGQRFVNEMETRDVVSKAILEQEGKTAFLLFNDTVRESLGAIEGYFKQNLVTEGKAEELGEALGIDANALIETLKSYGDAVAQNSDALGREHLEVAINPEEMLYAIEITPAVHHTMGGIEIDVDGHVIGEDNSPIKGLYAAGECTGGVHGANRLGGNAMADIIVFGRIAGASAVEDSKYL